MPAEVSLEHLTKAVDGKTILNDINLTIHPGEFLTLVGPSGCGKSTLLRIIAGLSDFTSGTVRIDRRDVSMLSPRERGVAMVFQSYALYPHMTVEENIATPLAMSELSSLERFPLLGRLFGREKKDEIRSRVKAAARVVELDDQLEKKPSQLSGGQRQRVAIARAMVREPGAFLMDEPLSNLDARLRTHMRGEIAKLHEKLGSTFIYVTHDQSEAMTLSDRIALMMGGQILQVGTPEELYERPADIRVAKFIGSPEINLIPVIIRAGYIELFGQRTPIRVAAPDDEHAYLGVRAQRVRAAGGDDPGSHEADLSLPIQVAFEREETLGEDVLVFGVVRHPKTDSTEAIPFTARLSVRDVKRLQCETNGFERPMQLLIDPASVIVFRSDGSRATSGTERAADLPPAYCSALAAAPIQDAIRPIAAASACTELGEGF